MIGHRISDSIDVTYLFYHVTVCNHPAKFGGHSHCSLGDLTCLIFHVILAEHVTKDSCDYMERSSLLHVTTSSGWIVVEMFLIYCVISRDRVFKGLCDFMGGGLSVVYIQRIVVKIQRI